MSLGGFLDKRNKIAVVGVSDKSHKFGYKIYKKLKSAGYRVYPVNPRHARIESDKCYPNLKSLPEKPNVVITVVRPEVARQAVVQCKSIGIGKVWMQPGSESKESIAFCKENGIEVVYNACFVVDGLKGRFSSG